MIGCIDLSHGTKGSKCAILPIFQEQMKQQQWQQQQQQGVLPQTVPSQPSSSAVPPPPHRPLYQPMQPHPQHLASMGFDPRWLMMQSYMDPPDDIRPDLLWIFHPFILVS